MADRNVGLGGISLRDVLPQARISGAADVRIARLSADSRHCLPGDLFVAVGGTNCDGHEFIQQAIARGAMAVVTDRPLDSAPVPVCLVDDAGTALGQLCQALAGNPSRRLKVVGITGTNGKTTTSYLAAGILEAAGCRTGILGTLGYSEGMELAKARWTTPPPFVLAPWLARIEAAGCSHAVMEVSSHALSQGRVAGVDFDVACMTNVRRDHLDYHESPRAYCAAKARLFEHLLPEGIGIFNIDDAACAAQLAKHDGPALSIGIDGPAEITATRLEECASEQTFLLEIDNETAPVRTSLIGRHNVYNCLCAAAIGSAYGIDMMTIIRGLESVSRVPGRLERIECGQPFGVFVDFAHTADALAAVLETLREVTPGRLICVFGAGGDRDRSKRPRMGRAVEKHADLAIVTSDNPRSEDPAAIAGEILRGFRNRSAAELVLDRAQAIRRALSQAAAGDTVLIAGKGHEDCQIIGQHSYPFDDRHVARQWLYSPAAASRTYRASA